MTASRLAKRRPAALPVPAYPAGIERVYEAALRAYVAALWRTVVMDLRRAYPAALAEVRRDSWYDNLASAVSRFFFDTEGDTRQAERAAREAAAAVGERSAKGWREIARKLTGVNVFRSESWLLPLVEEWSAENAKLIRSIRREFLDKVSARTADFVRQGRSLRDYSAELRKTYDLSRARASLIARTEVAKLNAAISEARQARLQIKEYEWATAADERVRKSHKALRGKICRWDDSTVYRNPDETFWRKRSSIGGYVGKPGTDFQCRCVGIPLVDDVVDALLKDVS